MPMSVDEEFDVCPTCNCEATCRWSGECVNDLESYSREDDEDYGDDLSGSEMFGLPEMEI